ncbi:TniB family NTP-binding protein [Nonomuraea thailandensis]
MVTSRPGIELEPGPEEDLSHLHDSVRPVARLPAAERLARVRADRWIGYTRATQALDQLHTLLDWPAKQRMPNLLVIGPTNNGKSMIVEKFRRSHPPISHPETEEIPVLVVQMPSDPHVGRFYTALLTALGAPLRPRQRLAELEQLLRQAAVRMLVIDELHNVLAGRDGVRREFLNLLRFLGNELKIPLVGVGTRDAYLVIRSDDQLENRFAPFVLPRWEAGREASMLLASFAAAFPLRRPSYLATAEMTDYLLARSEGTIGELAALLTEAAAAAIESGEEAITQRTLLLAGYAGPTERRRKFERELL